MRYTFIFIVFLIVITVGEYLIFISLNRLGLLRYTYIKNTMLTMGIVLPLMFVGSMAYGGKNFSLLNSWIYTAGGVWLGLLTYLVITTLLISILLLLNTYLGFSIPIKLITIILIFCSIATTVIGIINASNIRTVRIEVTSPSLSPLWKGKKIVLVSDTHLGLIRREKFMKKIVDIVNSEKPDITFNLGDLIDGPSFPYSKAFAPIDDLKSNLGNYYVEGNHESYSQEYNVFKENFPKNINDITGKKVIVNNTQIIGIPYGAMKGKDEINNELAKVKYDKSIPSIILMHDPKDTSQLADNGASLVLSGHTHGGQFFPFTLLVKMIAGKYFHGLTYTKDTAEITSYGVGTAMVPIRIGTVPEIVVVTIK